MKPVVIWPAAAADIDDVVHWYERQRPSLGNEFRAALRSAFASIGENPRLYPRMRRDTRRILVKRFPYGVYYREYADAIVVVACMHGSRDPRRWESRDDDAEGAPNQ